MESNTMFNEKRFWSIGKWVGFSIMGLGVLALFIGMCADRGMCRRLIPTAWAWSCTGVGMFTGSFARAMVKVVALRDVTKTVEK